MGELRRGFRSCGDAGGSNRSGNYPKCSHCASPQRPHQSVPLLISFSVRGLDATSVVAPAFDGEVGILIGHAPMMTMLGKGELRIEGGAGSRKFAIEGGFLQVVDNQVRVVTEKGSTV